MILAKRIGLFFFFYRIKYMSRWLGSVFSQHWRGLRSLNLQRGDMIRRQEALKNRRHMCESAHYADAARILDRTALIVSRYIERSAVPISFCSEGLRYIESTASECCPMSSIERSCRL